MVPGCLAVARSMLRQNSGEDDVGKAGRPFGPLNLLGDFAGGVIENDSIITLRIVIETCLVRVTRTIRTVLGVLASRVIVNDSIIAMPIFYAGTRIVRIGVIWNSVREVWDRWET